VKDVGQTIVFFFILHFYCCIFFYADQITVSCIHLTFAWCLFLDTDGRDNDCNYCVDFCRCSFWYPTKPCGVDKMRHHSRAAYSMDSWTSCCFIMIMRVLIMMIVKYSDRSMDHHTRPIDQFSFNGYSYGMSSFMTDVIVPYRGMDSCRTKASTMTIISWSRRGHRQYRYFWYMANRKNLFVMKRILTDRRSRCIDQWTVESMNAMTFGFGGLWMDWVKCFGLNRIESRVCNDYPNRCSK